MSSVALYVVESTLVRGFDSFRAHQLLVGRPLWRLQIVTSLLSFDGFLTLGADDGGRGLDHARFRNALPALTRVCVRPDTSGRRRKQPGIGSGRCEGCCFKSEQGNGCRSFSELREIGQVVKRSILTGAASPLGMRSSLSSKPESSLACQLLD